jgi:hypothetical protein
MRIPLLGGAYQSRSILANAQRSVNYFPELNPRDSPVPVTQYQRPGLVPLGSPATPGLGRGIWRASNGNGYCVVGQTVYQIQTNWSLSSLGTLATAASNPCSFVDNGTTGVLVDGSSFGYQFSLAGGPLTQISDPTGTFTGADRVDYIDTFVLWNVPGTNQFGSTLSNEISFDALYIAAKTDWPDPLQVLIVNRHEILLVGQLKTEQWYDAGNPLFPFAELPGAYFEHGTVSKYCVASADINVYWLGQDLQGQGVVLRARGYDCKRISNHALEYQLRQAVANGATLTDAIGCCYQQDGHVFYYLTLPSANQTWVWDEASEQWHQQAWTDGQGTLQRHRPMMMAFVNGLNVGLDWENGTIYQLDLNTYTDTVNGVTGPVTFIRGFPHILEGQMSFGLPGLDRQVESNGKIVRYDKFLLDLECGNGPADAQGNPAMIGLRWSNNRGKTFGTAIMQTSGALGQYETRPLWRNQGMAQDMVFEISHNIAGPAALNGAWVEAEVLNQ